MTINYLDSKRLQGLSTDTKPTIAIPLTGCKAYYKFEETSGNLINQATTANGFTDGLGSSADGTNNGATQTATGKIGNAWDFDGSNDFVQLSNYFNFLHNPSTSGTISAWIKHDVNSGGQFIISTFGNANDVNGIWTGSLGGMVFGLRPDGNPYYATVADNPSVWVVAENDSNNLATGVWYNIVFTKENNTFKVYVNGVLDASITASSTLRSGNSYATPTIGKHSNGSGYVFLNGGIDDLSIWSRALTTNEITNLYNSGSGKLLDTQTNVQTNSIFEQTDTNTRHWYNGTNWITQPTFEDDFTSYTTQGSADASWVSNDTTNLRVDITNDNMFSTNSNAGSTIMKNMYYDLTSVSDTAWVLRFKSTLSSFTARTDTNTQFSNITISSSTADTDTAQDWMGLTWNTHTGAGNIYDVGGKDNTAISQFNGTYFTKVLVSGETLYVELIRNGANITANLFSNATYTTLVETRTNTTTGTITGLRYLKSTIRKTVTGSNGTINLLLDDIKFYNGVTSV